MVNRSALVVRPKQPFLDWAAQLDSFVVLPDTHGEQSVYLLPMWDTGREAEKILKKVYATVFELELFDWHTNKSDWPKKRNLETFREWFHVEMHSFVQDLCRGPIFDDEA